MLRIKFVKLTLFLITLFFFTSCAVGVRKPPPPPSDTSGFTFYSASATSNVFVLKEVTSNIYVDCIYRPDWKQGSCTGITSEFSKGDIVTFGHSKEEYEIREAKVLKKSESGNIQDGYIHVGEYGWGGAASTVFWVNPKEEMVVIFLTQLLPSSTYQVRRELRSLVYSSLMPE